MCTSVADGSQKLGKLEPGSRDGSVAATITIDYEQELVCELLKYPVIYIYIYITLNSALLGSRLKNAS